MKSRLLVIQESPVIVRPKRLPRQAIREKRELMCQGGGKAAMPVNSKVKSVVAFALIASFLLTMATWLFFFYYPATTLMPLTGPETTFVFSVWFVIAFVVRWFWVKRK